MNNQFRLKRENFDIIDSSMTCMLFVVLESLFLLLFYALPVEFRAIPVVGLFASFGLEFMFALAGFLTSSIRGVSFFKATKLNKKINWKIVGFTFLIAIIAVYGFSSLSNYFIMGLEELGYKTSLSNIAIPNVFSYLLYLVLVCAVPAVFEEICFRGCICAGLESKNKHFAVWFSAFIFMIMHGGPEQTIHQLILGVIFGYIFVYTQNLWVTILIHFFNNAVAVTMMFIQSLAQVEGASGDVAAVGFGDATTLQILLSAMSGLIMAVTAGVLIYFLTKAIKKQLSKSDPEIEVQAEQNVSENNEQDSESNIALQNIEKSKNRTNNIIASILFALAIGYMAYEWIIELIKGFLR